MPREFISFGEKIERTLCLEVVGGALCKGFGRLAGTGCADCLDHLFAVGGENLSVEVPLIVEREAVSAKREFAAATHVREEGTFGIGGEARGRVLKGVDSGVDGGIASWIVGVKGMLRTAGFKSQGTLAGCGSELVNTEALMDRFDATKAVQTGTREDQSVALAGFQFAEPGVDISAQSDELQIGTQGEELSATAWAGGADAPRIGEGVESPEGFADEGVTGVGARWNGGDGEARVEGGREIFIAVDGEIDASSGEGFFNLLDEDSFTVETFRDDEAGLLHAVAGGANDFDLDGVALCAEGIGNMVGLPEGKLRATRTYADVCHVFR